MTPNQMQLLATIRTVLMFFAGTSVGAALFHTLGIPADTTTVGVLAGVVVGVGTYLWSLAVHTKQSTVARAADIVAIPATEQTKVGIVFPQTMPTSPKKP